MADVSKFWGADWWEAWQAFGTVAATAVAVLLAFLEGLRARRAEKQLDQERQQKFAAERTSAASLVSAWVETTYEPSLDRSHFLRRGEVFVANESNEPVFNVHVTIGVGQPPVQIGPLAVPSPIPVLPPRRQRSWDISLGLLAHGDAFGQIPSDPVACIDFSDVRDIKWHRDFDGRLSEQHDQKRRDEYPGEEEGLKQLGDPANTFNPVWAALAFLQLVGREEPKCNPSELRPILAEASGWANLDERIIDGLRDEVRDFGLAAHCWYPAPQVAYVRLIHDDDTHLISTSNGPIQVRAKIITLVFYSGTGWRVFSVGPGATAPDWIEFPKGAINTDPRSKYRTSRR